MRHGVLVGFVAVLIAVCAAELRGEIFVLAHGGRVEGRWINSDNRSPEVYEIETADGGRLTLSNQQVLEVIVKSEHLLRYEEMLPKVPDTLEGHWDMAERCRKAGLRPQRDYHLRRVVELDPNHGQARRGLGYSLVDGQWIKADEWLQAQGFIRHKGAWRLAQEVELDARAERRVAEEVEWRKRLRVWRSAVLRGRNDGAEAIAKIRAIDSAWAIAALAELLKDPQEPKQLVLEYIDVLGRFDSSVATAALLERAVKDSDLDIAERCLKILKARGTDQAVAVLSKLLKDKDNAVVNRGAWALGELGRVDTIPALIDALVTKHRFKVQDGNPGNMNIGFDSTGGNALQTGGGPKVVDQELPNQQVLSA
ncbi:MAG: HEAT repeat domain-containing protein, partial [Planctomycetes bacterium]|nr:HEAT repeat domain-containing protein [Planctomycetota bacterium]